MRRVSNYFTLLSRLTCYKEIPELFAEKATDMSVIKCMAHNVMRDVTELDA